jgi:hypothetical protein
MTTPVQPTSPAGAAGPPTVPAGTLVPVTSLKPGYKTSELILAALIILGQVFSAAADWIQPGSAAKNSTYTAIGYALARGLAKLNPPKDATP